MMRGALPDLIISDLNMPNMSGFELLGVVRKRFPSVAVIAMSAEFRPTSLPPELLVDRYLDKDRTPAMEIVEVVRELLESSPIRSQPPKAELTAVWVPRSETKYLVLTCPECLRSFSVRENSESGPRPNESCPHCEATVQYCIDATVANQPPCISRVDETLKRVESSKVAIEKSNRRLIRSKKSPSHCGQRTFSLVVEGIPTGPRGSLAVLRRTLR